MMMGAGLSTPVLDVAFAAACKRSRPDPAGPVALASAIRAMKLEIFGQRREESLRDGRTPGGPRPTTGSRTEEGAGEQEVAPPQYAGEWNFLYDGQ